MNRRMRMEGFGISHHVGCIARDYIVGCLDKCVLIKVPHMAKESRGLLKSRVWNR